MILLNKVISLFWILFASITANTLLPFGIEPSAGCTQCKSSLSFANQRANDFIVGNQIPGISFKTKTSWSGNIPIPDTESVKNGSLSFWLWGKDDFKPGNDLVIWMNGGPGGSSLTGMSAENGPFVFSPIKGSFQPNKYSWTLATNLLYLTQPIGAPFTTFSYANIKNEDEISQHLVLFLNEFFKIFVELRSMNIWLIGESYDGQMMPFAFNAIKQSSITKDLTLKGGMLISPFFSDLTAQLSTAIYPFAKKYQKQLNFTNEELATLKNETDTCHLTDFISKYLTYPPKGRLPNPSSDCSAFDYYTQTYSQYDPNYNIYNVNMPNITKYEESFKEFYNRTDVQTYIHAPHQSFKLFNSIFQPSNHSVFGDQSDPSDRTPSFEHSQFAMMIEKSERFIVMSGELDGLIFAQGVQLVLQNLTWGGAQGFMCPMQIPLYDLEGNKKAIATKSERNLRFVTVSDAGHMLPMDQPSFALNALFALLGHSCWEKVKC